MPLDIDLSLLNTCSFRRVSQPDLEIELSGIGDKHVWVSEFKSLSADLEDVACHSQSRAQVERY